MVIVMLTASVIAIAASFPAFAQRGIKLGKQFEFSTARLCRVNYRACLDDLRRRGLGDTYHVHYCGWKFGWCEQHGWWPN